MIPFLQKLKTKIVGFLGHDFFAFMFKNRREHLSYAKELKSLYPKPDKMTALGNYELPSSVLDSLNFDSIIITGGVEFHIEFEELLDNICNASFHFFEVDKRSIDWFKLNKEKSNFKIIEKGLGAKKGFLPVYGNEFMGWSSSVDPKIYENSMLDFKKIGEAEITTLPDYCKENNIINIDILKLDIEGMALEVLYSCWDNNLSPKSILLEIERGEAENINTYKNGIEEFLEKAKSFEYQCIFLERKDSFNSGTLEFFLTKS